jgi:4'-phosphopantetheinyl transferase EntD
VTAASFDARTVEELFPFPVRAAMAAVPAEGSAAQMRARERAVGRACARLALRRAGVREAVGEPADGGAPRWPDGVVGSISHGGGVAVAVVANADAAPSLGIDVEATAPALPRAVRRLILTPAEEALLAAGMPAGHSGADAATSAGDAIDWARIAFSAKEALYKAWHPLRGRFLEPREARVTLDPRGGRLWGVAGDGPERAQFAGAFALAGGNVICGCHALGAVGALPYEAVAGIAAA